jgi:hypothetical protein
MVPFSIPVVVYLLMTTGTRDPKILNSFWSTENTELISGEFKISTDNTCSIDVLLKRKQQIFLYN